MPTFIEKLRGLSDVQKKILIVVIVGICAIILGFFWLRSAAKNLSNWSTSINSIDFPEINLPDVDIPDQNNQVADWKTYESSRYGFGLQYPKEFFVQSYKYSPDSNSEDIYISSASPKDKISFIGQALDISVTRVKEDTLLADALKNRFGIEGTDFTKEPVTINNINAFLIKPACEGQECGQPELVFINNNYFYNVIQRNTDPVFDQIISTFKFNN